MSGAGGARKLVTLRSVWPSLALFPLAALTLLEGKGAEPYKCCLVRDDIHGGAVYCFCCEAVIGLLSIAASMR